MKTQITLLLLLAAASAPNFPVGVIVTDGSGNRYRQRMKRPKPFD